MTPTGGKAAFYAYAHPAPAPAPAPASFADATLSTAAARWNGGLGLYVLDWDEKLAASAEAAPPRVA